MARAARAARVKAPAQQGFVAQTRDQVVEAIAEIGRRQRERARIEAAMNDAIAEARQVFEEQAAPHAAAIRDLREGVQTWCEAHRAELTEGGRVKTVALASGEVRWRITPPKVLIRAADMVLQLLRERGLQRLIRTKEEVNKEAILADPAAVAGLPGVRIEQAEEFVVVPFETSLEEVA